MSRPVPLSPAAARFLQAALADADRETEAAVAELQARLAAVSATLRNQMTALTLGVDDSDLESSE